MGDFGVACEGSQMVCSLQCARPWALVISKFHTYFRDDVPPDECRRMYLHRSVVRSGIDCQGYSEMKDAITTMLTIKLHTEELRAYSMSGKSCWSRRSAAGARHPLQARACNLTWTWKFCGRNCHYRLPSVAEMSLKCCNID